MDPQIADILLQKQRFLIIASEADEDSLSCGILVSHILRSRGKEANVIHYDAIPDRYSYFPFVQEVVVKDPSTIDYSEFDAVITVDAGSLSQLMRADKAKTFSFPQGMPVLCIDHHAGNTRYATHYLYDAGAAAAMVLVYKYLVAGNYTLSKDEATLVLIGILGDTGYFRWDMSEEVLQIAHELVQSGAETKYIMNYMWAQRDMHLHKFIAYNASRIIFYPELRFSLLSVAAQDITMMGLPIEDYHLYTRPFHEMFTGVYRGFDCGGILIELDDHVTGSFRGNPYANTMDLGSLCRAVSSAGGGHFNSAGFFVSEKSLQSCKDAVLEYVHTFRQKEFQGLTK